MSVATSGGRGWGALLRAWQELDVPEGWRAEILAGEIVVSPSPDAGHSEIVRLVDRALEASLPQDWFAYQQLALEVPDIESVYIPDLVVMPRAALVGNWAAHSLPAEAARLAVEVVSWSRPRRDRVDKLDGYARAGIPVYLLVDRYAEDGPSVTVYSDPADGAYRKATPAPFGRPARLPEPLALEIDTSRFPT